MRPALATGRRAAPEYVCPSCRHAARPRPVGGHATLLQHQRRRDLTLAANAQRQKTEQRPVKARRADHEHRWMPAATSKAKKDSTDATTRRSPLDTLATTFRQAQAPSRTRPSAQETGEQAALDAVLREHSVLSGLRSSSGKDADVDGILHDLQRVAFTNAPHARSWDDILDAHRRVHTATGLSGNERTLRTAGATAGQQPRAWAWTHAPSQHADSPFGTQKRLFHSSGRRLQATAAEAVQTDGPLEDPFSTRAQLRRWRALHGDDTIAGDFAMKTPVPRADEPVNSFSRLPEKSEEQGRHQAEEDDVGEQLGMASSAREGGELFMGPDLRVLRPGDLVEIDYRGRNSMLAVYVRNSTVASRASSTGQFYAMTGRLTFMNPNEIQYSLPGFVSEELIARLLPYMPDVQSGFELHQLQKAEQFEDISIPRTVSAPILQKMIAFHAQSEEIYRLHSRALDNAHLLLAHETDLRYGSLTSIARSLLGIPLTEDLPLAAHFVVRRALLQNGLGFNFHRESHRQTGYLQIASKQQVRAIIQVRGWIRQWREHLVAEASSLRRSSVPLTTPPGAAIIESFIAKAKKIVTASREHRTPTTFGSVGPSRSVLPLAHGESCIQAEAEAVFTDAEQAIVRFLETWAMTRTLAMLPALESLPPMLLQGTGLYEGHALQQQTCFLFLQELGVLTPFENRVPYDQHLLLPSSQHSRPLERLMREVQEQRPDFVDSMADLRRDWKDVPVYCIDGPNAEEIDDGLSIERLGVGASGKQEFWLHIHIANPTAFMSVDSPLAKMARHMGETIYTPERAYSMLPKWVTAGQFSLGPDRPALTISARLDEDGNRLETRIEPSTLHNVKRLTYDEVDALMQEAVPHAAHTTHPLVHYTVGPELPSDTAGFQSRAGPITRGMVDDLATMDRLARALTQKRRVAGGLFYDMNRPDIVIQQTPEREGLSLMGPYRKGWRRVHGDPRISVSSRGFLNWFTSADTPSSQIVREAMLMASDIAGGWCAARGVPGLFRGTLLHQAVSETPEELRARFQLTPDRPWEFTAAMSYMRSLGQTVLRPTPLKHVFLGLDHYAKVTSPLRRYGDMILHWQIESALRHEASTGQSLLLSDHGASLSSPPLTPSSASTTGVTSPRDLSFLAFSPANLAAVAKGLQPREQIIMRAKARSQDYWIKLMLFRKFHFPEHPTSGARLPRRLPVLIVNNPADNAAHAPMGVLLMPLNAVAKTESLRPGSRIHGEEVRWGDIWEAEIEYVDAYYCDVRVKLIRKHCEDGWNDESWRQLPGMLELVAGGA